MMKFKLLGGLMFICLVLLSACGMSEEDKEKKFSDASKKYVKDITKTFKKIDEIKSEDPNVISKEAKKASKEIDKSYKDYKQEVDKELLKDYYDREELDKTFKYIYEIYSDLYMRLDNVGSIDGVSKEAYFKIAVKDIYIAQESLGNLKVNIENVETRKILGKEQNNNLYNILHTKEEEQEELIKAFALLQNKNHIINDTDKIPKRDMVKLNKYSKNNHTRTVSAAEFNELVDEVNKRLDKDSQISRVDDEVNVYVYNILMEINNALTEVHNEEVEARDNAEMAKYEAMEDKAKSDIDSPETEDTSEESDSDSKQSAREAELEKEYFDLSDKMNQDGVSDADLKSMEQRQNEILDEVKPY